MSGEAFIEKLRPWLRETHAPAFDAALAWLLPRCRTEEERCLAPALLLVLSPLNALVVPCRPVAGSCVNFQVTLSRSGIEGPERVRLTVRAGLGAQAFGRSGVQAQAPERVNAQNPGSVAQGTGPALRDPSPSRPPERQELWLDVTAVRDDPLGGAALVLSTLLAERRD